MYRQSTQTGRGDNDIGEYTSDSIIIIIIVIRMSYTRRLEGGDQSGQLPALSHCYLRSFSHHLLLLLFIIIIITTTTTKTQTRDTFKCSVCTRKRRTTSWFSLA